MRNVVGVAAVLAIGAMLGAPAFGTVVKTTTSTPAKLTTGVETSSIGLSFKTEGPGAIASLHTGMFSIFSGSLSHSADGSKSISYVESAPGSPKFKFVAAVVAGYSFCFAGATSFLFFSGSASMDNSLFYAVTKTTDGVSTVVLLDAPGTSVSVTSGTAKDFAPAFEFYGGLMTFTTSAEFAADVSVSTTASASPIAYGVASGGLLAFLYGS